MSTLETGDDMVYSLRPNFLSMDAFGVGYHPGIYTEAVGLLGLTLDRRFIVVSSIYVAWLLLLLDKYHYFG